jgi:hypothetical protein
MLSKLIGYGLNAFHASKDVVMTIGSGLVQKTQDFYVSVKDRVIEGEWLPKSMFASGTAVISLSSTSSMAAIDTSAALATFGDVNTAIPVVGAAFLAALGVLAAWKLIRGAFA